MSLDDKNLIKRSDIKDHTKSNVLPQIYKRLGQLKFFFEKEINNKQIIINHQQAEIDRLVKDLEIKNASLIASETKLHENEEVIEGNRQLINKLLYDIRHYQNDIEWYKRTYEKRNVLGIIKDKLKL